MKLASKSISQLGRVVTGKTPPTSRHEFFDGEYPFVTPSDIKYDHYYCRETERSITAEARAALPNQFLPANSVMFTCIGATIGKCAISSTDCLTNQQINSIIVNDNTDAKFLYYLLCHNVDVVKGLGGGAATPIVNKTKFEEIEFLVPSSFRDQQAISIILSTYDDLIENNSQRIALLEETARQLYREWFVRLRFPGHEHTRISNGAPESWARKSIGAHFTTLLGGTPSRAKPEYWDDGTVPWINSGKVNELRILQASEFITEIGLKNSAAKIMPKGTTVIAITGATLGQVSMLEIECAANQSVVGIIDETKANTEWLYLTMKERISELVARATGGAQVHINKDIVNAFEIVIPSKNISEIFRETVTPMFLQIANLSFQNIKLRAARDMLLPKLISGEIAV